MYDCDDIDICLNDLSRLEANMCDDGEFDDSSIVQTASRVITQLRRRPCSDEELQHAEAVRREAKRVKMLQTHATALRMVYEFFGEQLKGGTPLNPVRVGDELAKTIKDLT